MPKVTIKVDALEGIAPYFIKPGAPPNRDSDSIMLGFQWSWFYSTEVNYCNQILVNDYTCRTSDHYGI